MGSFRDFIGQPSKELDISDEVENVTEETVETVEPVKEIVPVINTDKKDFSYVTPTNYNHPSFEVETNIIEKTLGFLGGNTTIKTSDPLTPLDKNFITKKEFDSHYKEFMARVQHQLSTIGGGGEVNFRYLDDVKRSTMTGSNDNWVLEYDAPSGKVQFTKDIGPIDSVWFDPTHTDDHTDEGVVCWNALDRTLNITHQNGVKQQVGQESYFVVKNVTGNTIPNGTFVRFDGVTENGINRLDAAPFLADGTYPSLYGIGIATEDIADNAIGFVTNFGMVRGLNTTGSDVSESWQVGQILYASPTNAGKLTNEKPTAPNNVLPVAAIVKVDATEGEVFVRPTFEQKMLYGTVSSTQTQTVSTINTPTPITFNTIQNNLGISIGALDASKVFFAESGLYVLNFNTQSLSNNSSAKNVYFWLRINGVDLPYSTRIKSIVGNGVYSTFHITYNVSLNANDYIQFMWASTDTNVQLDASPATAFAPTSPSAYLHIDQAAL